MARFTQLHAWLTTVYQRLRSTAPQWFGHRASPPHIDDDSPGLSVSVESNAAIKQYELLPDDELLQSIARGDQQALSTLYQRHSRLVFSLALHITDDRLSAEEVTQDVFVLVWQRHSTFLSSAGTVQGWMAAITRNRAIDTLRSRQRTARSREVALDTEDLCVPHEGDTFERQIILRDMLREALDILPVTQCQALELACYDGLTAAEIAAVLDIPVGSVKSRLRLALTALRQAVRPEFLVDQFTAQDKHWQINGSG